jgi:tetratricopeptide (TPR) repeat protein
MGDRSLISRNSRRVAFLALCGLLGACRSGGGPTGAAPPAASASTSASASSSAAPSASAAPRDPKRALCTAAPGGATRIDGEILARVQRLEKQPDHAETLALLGAAWIRKARASGDPGFYVNADACATLMLDANPEDRLGIELQALVRLNDHRFSEAAAIARHALTLEPESIPALGTLSDALLEMGEHDDAIKAADKMANLKPALPSYSRVSYLQWLRGDTKRALETVRLAIDAGRDPREPEPRCFELVQAALMFWHQGDYGGADAGFVTALGELADYPPALVGRGRVAIAKQQYQLAIEMLEKAYAQTPLVETAWLLGDAYAGAGDNAKADANYARVVKEGRLSDHRTLALFYATKNRDIPEALELAEKELKVRPGIYTRDAYAWALYRAGKLDEAKAQIDKATALGTKDARLWYHAGAIALAKGDAKGRALVHKALELNPGFDFTGAAEARKLDK